MFLVGMLNWWYGQGWRERIRKSGSHLSGVVELFSIGQLLSTLFSPFRQISAGRVSGSATVQVRAFFDKVISRIIGAIVRTIVIIAGLLTLAVQAVYQCVVLILWLVLPLFLIVGCILAVIGWTPSWI
jgi:hypothetical protein